jgi:integrase
MKLTAKTISAIALPRGKTDAIAWDDEIAGFGFRTRLGAGGKVMKSWVLQYKHAGTTRRLLLGSAVVFSADQARAEARKARAKVELGQDPQADKSARRDKDRYVMRAIVAEYLAAKRSQVRPRTYVEVSRYLTGHFRSLANMPIDTITRRDVAACIVRITRGSGAATAGAARNALSAFFAWAMGAGLAEVNPVIGTNRAPANKPRERVLSDVELAAVWRACDDDDYGKVVRLLILTGCRREEIGGMRWSEFAPDGTTWTLPAERSKNERPLTLPVLPMMREIISNVPHMATREQLFGERSQLHGFTRWHCKPALDERSGTTDWTLHDLRRTCATRMADIGVQPHIIEAVLNHYSGHRAGVAGVYNRSPYANDIKNALAQWHDHLRALVEGGERKVLQLRVR